jgi:hypothetical protein
MMPEILLNSSLSLITKLIDKGEFSLVIFSLLIIIGVLVYFLYDALGYKVLSKQMTVYRDRIRPVIEEAKTGYAYALQTAMQDGTIKINSSEFGNILARHADLVDACFLKAERYMRDRLFENHIPTPADSACNNDRCRACTDTKCREWREYCEGTFEAHIGIIWGEYRNRYSTRFFPLSIFDRERIFQDRIPAHYVEWCQLLNILSRISKNRWGLK